MVKMKEFYLKTEMMHYAVVVNVNDLMGDVINDDENDDDHHHY